MRLEAGTPNISGVLGFSGGIDSVTAVTLLQQTFRRVVAVTLDTRLSPSANAQRFYKKYTKAKHAVEYLTREILSAEEEALLFER